MTIETTQTKELGMTQTLTNVEHITSQELQNLITNARNGVTRLLTAASQLDQNYSAQKQSIEQESAAQQKACMLLEAIHAHLFVGGENAEGTKLKVVPEQH